MNTSLMHPDDAADLMGDGYRNDAQRAHAASGEAFRASDSRSPDEAVIARLLASGRHVAVEFQPVYCRSTDAYIGECKSLLLHAPTREALVAALEAKFAANDTCLDDGRVELLPALPAPAPEPYGEAGGVDGGVPF